MPLVKSQNNDKEEATQPVEDGSASYNPSQHSGESSGEVAGSHHRLAYKSQVRQTPEYTNTIFQKETQNTDTNCIPLRHNPPFRCSIKIRLLPIHKAICIRTLPNRQSWCVQELEEGAIQISTRPCSGSKIEERGSTTRCGVHRHSRRDSLEIRQSIEGGHGKCRHVSCHLPGFI